ncbi:MAG TPA: nucleotidyltransferase family protein [Deltaproteobacteria bacterium]|jgi:GTP:adenosylcobinamide-phosphate guanylyltransferase|nr:nucleotidyltransferase family protein [Deltaproteobacteria bacterium]
MGIDVVIAAGDGRASRKVFRKNKAMLDVAGKPMILHIVEVLRACSAVDKIVAVGPKEVFEEIIGGFDVRIVQQKRSLAENGWEGFLCTIDEYWETGRLTPDILERYHDKPVLFLSGDIPLISVKELNEFISQCDMERYDYIAGATSENVLKLFGPRKGRPGIKMATFHMWDGNLRQNNFHMAKPFLLLQSIDLVLEVYEYRYQREIFNIIKSFFKLIRFSRGNIFRTLGMYLTLQASAGLSALGFERAAHLASFPVTRPRMERLISHLLNVRFKIVLTTVGGAALDVDNEKDYITLSIMYRDWMNQIAPEAITTSRSGPRQSRGTGPHE